MNGMKGIEEKQDRHSKMLNSLIIKAVYAQLECYKKYRRLECYFLTETIEQKNVNTSNDSFHNKQLITKTFFLQFRK